MADVKSIAILPLIFTLKIDGHQLLVFPNYVYCNPLKNFVNDLERDTSQNKITKKSIKKQIAFDIAGAIAHAHSKGIIITNISQDIMSMVGKSQNDSRVKIVSLNEAIIRKEIEMKKFNWATLQPGKVRAPEIVSGVGFSNKIDCWSFGIFLFYLKYNKDLFNACHRPGEHLKQISMVIGDMPSNLWKRIVERHKYQKTFHSILDKCTINGKKQYVLDVRPGVFENGDYNRQLLSNYFNLTDDNDSKLCDLLSKILTWGEKERINASDIMIHDYFESIHSGIGMNISKNKTIQRGINNSTSLLQKHIFC